MKEAVTVRPIPRSLLIHAAIYKPYPAGDGFGTPATAADISLDHIRMEPSHQLTRTKDNNEVKLRALLIYDARSSNPGGMDFSGAEGNRILFGSELYKIVSSEPLYDNHRLHHWELGLI